MSNAEHADVVLTGGRIFTADGAGSWARALAVRGGRIAVVGTDAAAMALAGPGTRVIDLRGRTVTPGFGDSHCHPTSGGLARIRCELHEARGKDEYLGIIGAYAAAHPDLEWILGSGWSLADFPGGLPRREDLDRVVPDRPVFLPNRDGHDAWVNSRALELAGITAHTRDPAHGRIARDPDGTPLGTLHEGAADFVERLLPETSAQDMRAALLEGHLPVGDAEAVQVALTSTATATRPPTAASTLSTPSCSNRSSSASTRSGSSRTSTRSAIVPSARRSTPSRPPASPTAGPTHGRTSRTSRSSIPTICRASAASARSPTPSRSGPSRRTR